MIEIDGSQGEGGGQILRSALALSLLTGRPFRLVNIRANRPKPGLAAQHLTCVKAAAAIGSGFYKGGSIGSTTLYFEPGPVKSGPYDFRIGTAGATGLVLHTVALPLALRGEGESRVTIHGGTHVSHSPCYDFLATTWSAYLAKMGIDISLRLERHGFYPRGGGTIEAIVTPTKEVRGIRLMTRAELTTAGGFSAIADLPDSVGERQARRLAERLKRVGLESHLERVKWEGGPASVAAVIFRQTAIPTLFYALGERGKSSERVADEAAEQAIAYRDSGAPVDSHSADQLLLPLVFANGPSEFRVSEVTRHLTTNIATIQQFVDRGIICEGIEGEPGVVKIG